MRVGSCDLGGCGWSLIVESEYAFVSTSQEFLIIDVGRVATPVVVGRDSTYAIANAVDLIGGHAFLLQDVAQRIAVYDVVDRTDPRLVLSYPLGGALNDLWTTTDSTVFVSTASGIVALRFDVLPEVTLTPVALATDFGLAPAYPNPFNATTTIAYTLARPGAVSLAVYDLHGRLAATLANETQAAGRHSVRWNAAVPTGTYFVRLQSGALVDTQKLLLLK